jgi:hypothetical protein
MDADERGHGLGSLLAEIATAVANVGENPAAQRFGVGFVDSLGSV